jgi:2-polyprenyl-6-methoxyphenol hydroxylase-like FAD-dependent oxidoreductase
MVQYDVVIVGGGIAGSALGAVLATAGLDVLVLERQRIYRDKVRGEYMHPWGVAEMLRLGLEEALLAAGGGYSPSLVSYSVDVDPADARAGGIPLSMLLPGVAGSLCVGHPEASEALNALAALRGAAVVRGVGDLEVITGSSPVVRYEADGELVEVGCRLVVGADGRQSTVRRALGIELETAQSTATLGGMLVRADWTDDASFVGSEGDQYYLGFPRPNGYVRLYRACTPSDATAGPDRAQRMLDAFRLSSLPDSDRLAAAEPAGPCSFYVGSDSWTARPLADGAVLVGDAAGWSDPIIGEGLSVAMRDARSVADVLLGGDDWSADAFEPYVVERAERMRRLRIVGHVTTTNRCTFTEAGLAQRRAFSAQMHTDPLILGLMLSSLTGPETGPADAYEQSNVDRILSLA